MKNMTKEGTIFMESATKMSVKQMSKYFKDWQISDSIVKSGGKTRNTTDTNRFIGAFSQANYSQEEIRKLYEKAAKSNLITDSGEVDFNEAYQKYIKEEEHPEIEHLTTISGQLDDLKGLVEAQNGVLSDNEKDKYKDLSSKEHDNKVKKIYENPDKFKNTDNYNKTKSDLDAEVQKENAAIERLKLIR